jgi:hypothetical protein
VKVQLVRRIIASAASVVLVGAMLTVATCPAWATVGSVAAVSSPAVHPRPGDAPPSLRAPLNPVNKAPQTTRRTAL